MRLVLGRFRAGAQRIVDAVAIRHNVQAIEEAEGADRFAAVADLAMQLENHPHKEAILRALRKKADKNYTGLWRFLAGCQCGQLRTEQWHDSKTKDCLYPTAAFCNYLSPFMKIFPYCLYKDSSCPFRGNSEFTYSACWCETPL